MEVTQESDPDALAIPWRICYPDDMPTRPGRPERYGLSELAVGDSVLIHWRAPGDNDHIRCAVKHAAKRYGRSFRRTPEAQGLRVTRMPDPVKII